MTSQIPAAGKARGKARRVASDERRAPSMLLALERVLSASGFPYASGYRLFKDAYFGRDSLEVAEDLLEMRPDLARTVILRLAALQGTTTDPVTEEQPGKIHHEYRALTLDGRSVCEEAQTIFRNLVKQWELCSPEELDALTELVNYGTVDATPLYVRLVARYCDLCGRDILDEAYTPRRWEGSEARPRIRDSVHRAVEWIVATIERSSLGLLEFQRMTPRGHRFQAWKDGSTSYLHTDGSFANYNAPIASIEVQGLAHDALHAACQLLAESSPAQRKRWTSLADRLRDEVMGRFWMPDCQYFAMALDRDPGSGEVRQVETVSSNPGALLDSSIFDGLPPDEQRRAVTAIVERIYSDQFLTPVGIRCSSVSHQGLLDYMAYQSSYTVWHKETYDVARGLRRQGFPALADDLEVRLLNAVNLVGGATEFLYVLPDGRVDLDPFGKCAHPVEGEILCTNVPENDQAWSISAALAVKWRRGHQANLAVGDGWQRAIEERKARAIPPARLLRTNQDIEGALDEACRFTLNLDEGWRREMAFVRAHELSTEWEVAQEEGR